MQIRDARPMDAEFIFQLGDLEFTPYGEHGGVRCLKGMNSPGAMTLVCEDETTRQPLGFAIVTIWKRLPYLFALATDPERRRFGVGKALMQECFIRIPSKFGRSELVLHVAESNHAALSLFKWLGFQETPEPGGRRRRWPGVPDVAIRMVRTLSGAASSQS